MRVSVVIAVFVLFLSQVASRPQSFAISVDRDAPKQEIWGYGASAIPSWTSDFQSKLTKAEKKEILDFLFLREGDGNCGFEIIRSRPPARREGETSNPDMLTHEPVDGQWQWEGNQAFRSFAAEASKRNPHIDYMILPWSPPSWMKTSGATKGGSLKKEHYADFGNYLAEFVRHYRNSFGLNIRYVLPQNEPHHNTQDWDACYYKHADLGIITELVSDSIKKDFPDILIGFSEANPKEHLKYWAATTSEQQPKIDFIAYHEYEDDPETDFNASGKPVIMTEFSYYRNSFSSGADMGSGLSWGRSIIGDLRDRGERGKLWWSFFSEKSTDEMFVRLTSPGYQVQKRMYVQGHFSRFHGKGHRVVPVVESASGLDVLASLAPDSGFLSVTCVNSSSSSREVSLRAFGGTKVDVWVTDAARSLVKVGSAEVTERHVVYTLPGKSVVSFVEKASSVGLGMYSPPEKESPAFEGPGIDLRGRGEGTAGPILPR